MADQAGWEAGEQQGIQDAASVPDTELTDAPALFARGYAAFMAPGGPAAQFQAQVAQAFARYRAAYMLGYRNGVFLEKGHQVAVRLDAEKFAQATESEADAHGGRDRVG